MPRVTGKKASFHGLFWFCSGLLLFGCGFHREGAAVERLRARIQAELGSAASVNVRSAYGSTTVTIRLAPLPAGDTKRVQERIEEMTRAEFPQAEYVVVLPK